MWPFNKRVKRDSEGNVLVEMEDVINSVFQPATSTNPPARKAGCHKASVKNIFPAHPFILASIITVILIPLYFSITTDHTPESEIFQLTSEMVENDDWSNKQLHLFFHHWNSLNPSQQIAVTQESWFNHFSLALNLSISRIAKSETHNSPDNGSQQGMLKTLSIIFASLQKNKTRKTQWVASSSTTQKPVNIEPKLKPEPITKIKLSQTSSREPVTNKQKNKIIPAPATAQTRKHNERKNILNASTRIKTVALDAKTKTTKTSRKTPKVTGKTLLSRNDKIDSIKKSKPDLKPKNTQAIRKTAVVDVKTVLSGTNKSASVKSNKPKQKPQNNIRKSEKSKTHKVNVAAKTRKQIFDATPWQNNATSDKQPSKVELYGVLYQYTAAYQNNNSVKIARLFSKNANTGTHQGIENIQLEYGRQFLRPGNRHLRIKDVKWVFKNNHAKGTGNFRTHTRFKNYTTKTSSGIIQFIVEKNEDDEVFITELYETPVVASALN